MYEEERSLRSFIESRFALVDQRSERQHLENRAALAELTKTVQETNGRVRKAEIAIAVLKFAVYTIGGGLVVAGLQVIVARFGQ